MTRFALALVASFALAATVRAADLPAGTWAANIDGTKGDFVVKEVKAGTVTGSLLDTDITGTWDGKTLSFKKGAENWYLTAEEACELELVAACV